MNWLDPHPHNHQGAITNDIDYTELCKNSKPSDFYVAIRSGVDFCGTETMIGIVPKDYFDKNNYAWDQTMFLDHILPNDFSEAMECVYECDRSINDVRKDLLARGFLESKKFNKMLNEDFD